jgi:hypothetical protein
MPASLLFKVITVVRNLEFARHREGMKHQFRRAYGMCQLMVFSRGPSSS